MGAEFGIGIVLSYALKEVEARCAVTYRGDSVPISECRYHFRAHCGTRPFLLGVSEKRGKSRLRYLGLLSILLRRVRGILQKHSREGEISREP